jgi:nitrate reductase assembly molybdenum cofactor insertion protein NarJ
MTTLSTVDRATIRIAFEAVGELLRIPDESFGERLSETLSVFTLQSSGNAALEAFAEEIVVLDRGAQVAEWNAAFGPRGACPPLLGVHLFGDGKAARERLVARLRDDYRKGGVDADAIDAPDAIAEVLSFAGRFEDQEWAELGHRVLRPALAKMSALLGSATTPYRHLVAAALELANEAFPAGDR